MDARLLETFAEELRLEPANVETRCAVLFSVDFVFAASEHSFVAKPISSTRTSPAPAR